MKLNRYIHIVALCLLAILSQTVQAIPMLTPSNVAISSGGTGELILTNTGTGCTSYQTDVYLPNGITITSAALSDNSTDHQCVFAQQADGAYRIIVSSQTLAELPELELKCRLSAPITSNVSGKAFLRNTVMVYTNGSKRQRAKEMFFVADKANKLSASVNMETEKSGTITMDFSNAEGLAMVTGIQMDITFGEGLSPECNADGSLKATSMDSNHTIASEDQYDGSYRIVVSSMNNSTFANSKLLTLPFTIGNEIIGKTSTIAWAKITYVLADGYKTYAADGNAILDLTWEEPVTYDKEIYDFATFVSQSTPNLKLTTPSIEQSGTNAKTVYVMDDYDNLNLHGRIALDSNNKTDNTMRWMWRTADVATYPYRIGLAGNWHGNGIAVNNYNLSILNLRKNDRVTILYTVKSGKNGQPCTCSGDVISETKGGEGLAAESKVLSDTKYYMLKDGNLDLYVLNDNMAIQKIVVETVVPATNISLNRSELKMFEGASSTLTVAYDKEEDYKGALFWKSSNPDVATVSVDGVVKAIAEGTATITATYASCKTALCQVSVVSKPVLKGDADSDGEVTMSDAKLVAKYFVGLPCEIDEKVADMNGDKKISMADANAIINYLMSLREVTYSFEGVMRSTNEEGYSLLTFNDGATLVLSSDKSKTYSQGSTINGMTSIKLSNAQENVFTAPVGQKIESVTFISVVNKDSNEENRINYWSKVNGIEYSTKDTPDYPLTKEFKSFKDYENPDIVTFWLGGVSSFNFRNSGYQPIVLLKVKYLK
ncbi:MAG: Ig-like domain-containing protein [Prevotella sp.]|nr:Ig-like domain-containing protein [Candidatus Prevotella equi]